MSDFETDFLKAYLQFGLGSMPKSDVDALVMHLLDKYGYKKSPPLSLYKNQIVSERLRTPVSKIKKLRYDAALKFGGDVEEEAKARLLVALSNASLEPDGAKICLIIEDALAKNWLQGQLKENQLIFDHSFNTEILKVRADGLFVVLAAFFDDEAIAQLINGYEKLKSNEDIEKMRESFKKLVFKFAESAAQKAGEGVFAIVKTQLGL